ncbi:uncharacterized protein J8A68_001160 [[Candida] subhashii]|uniref:Zn(2)-C6 fungal-type domain-containing protein n=1 Tax=[Candida] subhashii TaxID=561895 RepID=A0A8J5QLV2_9ASCO|nr:uncharacterized protein J8A68_001160 [[Candida] subhashii]KAG7665472.1 hypothetical protein J8A68_001160 [[Candida] subhashii]
MTGDASRKTRSRTGCFTCRRRKKKCDELSYPICQNCQVKGLECAWPPLKHEIHKKVEQVRYIDYSGPISAKSEKRVNEDVGEEEEEEEHEDAYKSLDEETESSLSSIDLINLTSAPTNNTSVRRTSIDNSKIYKSWQTTNVPSNSFLKPQIKPTSSARMPDNHKKSKREYYLQRIAMQQDFDLISSGFQQNSNIPGRSISYDDFKSMSNSAESLNSLLADPLLMSSIDSPVVDDTFLEQAIRQVLPSETPETTQVKQKSRE